MTDPKPTRDSGRVWRIATVTVISLVAVAAFAGAVWLAVTTQELRDQLAASQSNAQKLYVQLLDEGVHPKGQPPSQVAPTPGAKGDQGPKGDKGDPGGPGLSIKGDKGDPGAPGAPGAPGQDGQSIQGEPGPQGSPGADSTVPGPAGPQGAPGAAGPTCPDGFTSTLLWVDAAATETDKPTHQQIIACVPTPAPTP